MYGRRTSRDVAARHCNGNCSSDEPIRLPLPAAMRPQTLVGLPCQRRRRNIELRRPPKRRWPSRRRGQGTGVDVGAWDRGGYLFNVQYREVDCFQVVDEHKSEKLHDSERNLKATVKNLKDDGLNIIPYPSSRNFGGQSFALQSNCTSCKVVSHNC
jgi:hypothetical protein